jgi:hypothetical protein
VVVPDPDEPPGTATGRDSSSVNGQVPVACDARGALDPGEFHQWIDKSLAAGDFAADYALAVMVTVLRPVDTCAQRAALLDSTTVATHLPHRPGPNPLGRWPRPRSAHHGAVGEAAEAAEVPKSAWIRQAIEAALAMQVDQDEPISRADALRALTLLRTIPPVA